MDGLLVPFFFELCVTVLNSNVFLLIIIIITLPRDHCRWDADLSTILLTYRVQEQVVAAQANVWPEVPGGGVSQDDWIQRLLFTKWG